MQKGSSLAGHVIFRTGDVVWGWVKEVREDGRYQLVRPLATEHLGLIFWRSTRGGAGNISETLP
jgi:hypothetical protein